MSVDDGPLVLVTGGAGFIGCAIADRLVRGGSRVVAVDSLHPQIHPQQVRPAALPSDVELVVADVTLAETWDALLGERGLRPHVVVHLAAETGTGQSLTESTRHADVNVVGTAAMLDALLRHDAVPGHLLLSSSRAVYGEGRWQTVGGESFYPPPRSHRQLEAQQWDCTSPDGTRATARPHRADTTEPAPTSVYGATKLCQEHMMRAWCLAGGTALSILRLQNVYGPGQSLTNSYTGIVTLFSRLAAEGRSIPLYEDGQVLRDFIYIDDVAAAMEAALAVPPPQGMRVLDVGSGRGTTIQQLAQAVVALHSGAPAPHVTGAFRDGDVRHASADVARTVEQLPWRPTWTLADGLAELRAWVAAQESP
jgi:dTDP-L-rhamnose 4-epimerase